MPLTPPNLDDRTYEQLLDAALSRVRATCPTWTDLSEHDPGRVLLEQFSYLTEVMLYRLNRLPEKAYVALLNLLGVQQRPPYAAMAEVVLSRAEPATGPLRVPAGTEVSLQRGGAQPAPPVFVLAREVNFADGQTEARAEFFHAKHTPWRRIGEGSGQPGLELALPGAPLVANGALEVRVAIELGPDESPDRFADVVKIGEHTCGVWREVERFVRSEGEGARVFEVDRTAGRLLFAPSVQRRDADDRLEAAPRALAAEPGRGRAIYADYWTGGGPDGNVPAHSLNRLKRAVPGLKAVDNPEAAAGGRDAETLDNTMRRAPVEVFSLERAVTKLDYETVAQRVGGVSRTRAFNGVQLWPHERPGSVVVLLVPEGQLEGGQPMLTQVLAWQQQVHGTGGLVLEAVRRQLEGRQPLGATLRVSWARYKQVRVSAKVVATPSEDPETVLARVMQRLERTISPLPEGERIWPFGRALRISDVYEMLLADPGVRYAEDVRLLVDEVPDAPSETVAADPHLHGLWYAGSGPHLFRSQNDGESWENLGLQGFLPNDLVPFEVPAVAPNSEPRHAGLVAVAVNAQQGSRTVAAVLVSDSTGEGWEHWFTITPSGDAVAVQVKGLAWIDRGGHPVLLVASTQGLYARTWGVRAGAELTPIAGKVSRGCASVSSLRMPDGSTLVAVGLLLSAEQPQTEVYLATLNPAAGEGEEAWAPAAIKQVLDDGWRPMGRSGEVLFRVVRLERVLSRAYLWFGVAVPGSQNQNAVWRAELATGRDGAYGINGQWAQYGNDYEAGSCYDLAFCDGKVWAATSRRGLLCANHPSREAPTWRAYGAEEGLPARPDGRGLFDVQAVATRPASQQDLWAPGESVVMVGGPRGVLRGRGEDPRFVSRAEHRVETVSLPPSGLFCSGAHEIEVTRTDEKE